MYISCLCIHHVLNHEHVQTLQLVYLRLTKLLAMAYNRRFNMLNILLAILSISLPIFTWFSPIILEFHGLSYDISCVKM